MDTSEAPDFAKRGGLITAIAQDHASGEILMVAYMNQESFRRTLERGALAQGPVEREHPGGEGDAPRL
jgi:phosphoribosyl-AMP cyclohydrolase